ncbi:histidinol dehydrogenase [Cupriavidus basilensis]
MNENSMENLEIRRLDSTEPRFAAELREVLAFEASEDEAIDRAVAQILADVKTRGDAAVLEYTQRFDRVDAGAMGALEVSPAKLEAALDELRAQTPRCAGNRGGARARLPREAEDRVRQP